MSLLKKDMQKKEKKALKRISLQSYYFVRHSVEKLVL